jgi:energy-coupling factor transporter ATP-binding protein EcfA2
LARKIHEVGGFWYAAHVTQENGILTRKTAHNWIDSSLLLAAQIPGAREDLPQQFKEIILNKDPNWMRDRPVAVINARDVAKPQDLADRSATCLIKMTRPTFDAFKVAFLDPESRVRLNTDEPASRPGAVHALRVSGGYLDGLHAVFSGHLDTVIGGRGSGKSTLIECLRFGLDLLPKGTQARKQHNDIIKENLGKEAGRVEVDLSSSAQHGKRYLVTRRYGEAPIVRDDAGQVSNLVPRDLLPEIDIYGQNEIYELAQDEGSRLRLLERFLPDDDQAKTAMAQVQRRLQDNADRLAKALDDKDDLQAQVNKLPKLQEQLQGFQALGLQDQLARVPLFERERQIDARVQDELRRTQAAADAFEGALPDLAFITDKAVQDLPHAALLVAMRGVLQTLQDKARLIAGQAKSLAASAAADLAPVREQWRAAQATAQADIDKALRSLPASAGKTGPQIGAEYQRLQQEIERIKPISTRVASFAQLVEGLQQERRNLLAQLSDLRHRRLQALQKAAKSLTRRLEGRLSVGIQPEADRRPLKDFLLECKLDGVREARLAWIDEKESFSPMQLAASILEGKGVLEVECGLTPLVADALAKLPRAKLMALEALELGHRVRIELNVAHDGQEPAFRPLDKLSTGQQCTAILHLLLLDNPDPLVMDQPEDNLDNAFIAERIVRELRQAKTKRQFIFATHNANIPVFGDAEWIGVFTATQSQGTLDAASQGSIDVPQIRDSVAIILEGGREAFMQRKTQYGF